MKILIILFALSSCGVTNQENSYDDTIKVKVGEKLDIKLDVIMGTGYSWSLADSAFSKNLSFDTTYVINNQSEKEGAPETQVFQFTGLVKGNTSLHFIHSRPWQKGEPADKERNYKVSVQ